MSIDTRIYRSQQVIQISLNKYANTCGDHPIVEFVRKCKIKGFLFRTRFSHFFTNQVIARRRYMVSASSLHHCTKISNLFTCRNFKTPSVRIIRTASTVFVLNAPQSPRRGINALSVACDFFLSWIPMRIEVHGLNVPEHLMALFFSTNVASFTCPPAVNPPWWRLLIQENAAIRTKKNCTSSPSGTTSNICKLPP